MNKAYNKAEPLYLDAISILEESFGPEDIRYTMDILQTIAENAYTLFNDKDKIPVDHVLCVTFESTLSCISLASYHMMAAFN